MDKRALIRLCTFLISEEQSSNRGFEVLGSLIDVVFLDKQNSPLISLEIKKSINSIVGLDFTLDEIDGVLSCSDYSIFYNKEESRYAISPERYSILQKKEKRTLKEYFSNFLLSKGIGADEVENHLSVFYKYLYISMNNTSSIKSLFNPTERKAADGIHELREIDEEYRLLINEFLDIDDINKNNLIFKIVTSGIEFFSISGCENSGLLKEFGLSDQHFFLDTNILFRALGLNGKRRKDRVIQFFEKCNETNQSLIISSYSQQEFENSLHYHSDQIERYKLVNSTIFSEYSFEEDFYKAYYEWKKANPYFGIDLFITQILSEYDELIRTYNIQLDDLFLQDNPENQEKVYYYGQAIESCKRGKKKSLVLYDFETPDRSVFDAKNILYIENIRVAEVGSKIPQNYLISADHYLIEWDHSRPRHVPIVLMPSHWIAILMKYSTRTSDDYKSFISFINLPGRKQSINNEQLGAILEGIGTITQDETMQEVILLKLIDTKIHKILSSKRPELIIEKTVAEAKVIFDIELNELREKQKVQDEKIANADTSISSLTESITKLNETLGKNEEKGTHLEDILRSRILHDKLFAWTSRGILSLIPFLISILSILMLFLFRTAEWNIIWSIVLFIDKQTSETIKTFCYLFLAVPIGGVTIFGKVILRNLLSKKEKEKMISEIDYEREIQKIGSKK